MTGEYAPGHSASRRSTSERPFSAANGSQVSATVLRMPAAESGSGLVVSFERRAKERKSDISSRMSPAERVMRSICFAWAGERGVIEISSALVSITVSGVLSSWLTSPVKAFSRCRASWSLFMAPSQSPTSSLVSSIESGS